jgi:eukaryotic-like serine/threonine-protein kinase
VPARSSVADGATNGLPSTIGAKYRPVRVIGSGGMSVVYEVEHAFTKDRLALKVLKGSAASLDPVALARFRREARVSALVKSEHIVRVFDADVAPELGGAPFLVMDLLRGADLATVVGTEAQPPERVLAWLRQIARALDAAHHCGVVHRDLKPENVFLTDAASGGALKILDFGVARIPSLEEAHGTATGGFVGTPLYMSPEQASGGEVGPPADIWSVGVCAFRLLSGRDYWSAPSLTLLLAKIVYEHPVAPSERQLDLGTAFDAWFLRSCARRPDERWDSVGTQVEGLATALGLPVLEIPPFVAPDTGAPLAYGNVAIETADGDTPRAHSLVGTVTHASPEGSRKSGLAIALLGFGVAALTAGLLIERSWHPAHGERPTDEATKSAPRAAAVGLGAATPPPAPLSPATSAPAPAATMLASEATKSPAPSAHAEPVPPARRAASGLARPGTTDPSARAVAPRATTSGPLPPAHAAPPAPAAQSAPSAPGARAGDPLADPD